MSITDKRLEEIKDCEVWDEVWDDDWVNLTKDFFNNKFNFHDGFARFRDDKGRNWIDTEGNIFSDKRYEFVGSFHEGFAWFWDDKGFGFIHYLGFEFRNNLDFSGAAYEKDFEKNKSKLLEMESKLLKDFPKGSMKRFILEKICR